MRTFLAIELPAAIQDALAGLQQQLRESGADVTWVEPGNLHLTMRFLGEVTEAQCGQVQSLSREAAAQAVPVTVSLGALGAFPSSRAPRVIWAGIEQGKDELGRLAGRLESDCITSGFPKADHSFSAHVTLGRVRSPRGHDALIAQLQTLRWTPPGPFVVDHLTLFESRLSSRGSTYRAIERFSFQQ